MPISPTGQCIPFTAAQIAAMNILTFKVRDQTHPTEMREPDMATMTRTFFTNWYSRFQFFELVLGNVNAYNNGGLFTLSRLVPDPKYGVHPNRADIIATKIIRSMGFGRNLGDDSNGMPFYETAQIEVGYESVPFSVLTDDQEDTIYAGSEFGRYVTPPLDITGESEYFTLPGGVLHYVVNGGTAPGVPVPHLRAIQFNLGKVTPLQRFTFRWCRLPEAWLNIGSPLQTLLFQGSSTDSPPFSVPYVGCVNSEEFGGYPPGTLLLENAVPKISRDLLGRGWNYDLMLYIAYRPTGWLTLPYVDPAIPGNTGYYFVSNGNTYFPPSLYASIPDNTCLYNLRNLNQIFFPLPIL